MDSIVGMVFCETVRPDRALHLGQRNVASAPHGPADEFCVEIHAADDADKYPVCGNLGFDARRGRPVAGLLNDGPGALRPAGARPQALRACGQASVSIRRLMSSEA